MVKEKFDKILIKILWEMIILLVATITVFILDGNKLDVFHTYLLIRIAVGIYK